MADIELLWGSDAFWRRAASDIGQARRRLYVQAMTFEGDAAGLAVARAVAGCPAGDRRVLVDAYTRHVVNDRFVWSPAALCDRALRAEVRATRTMFADLRACGVAVRMTNPVGPFFARYPARNHKKLILADEVAYIGGVNFSDHNFAWTDLMVRFELAGLADFLAADFEATFASAARAGEIAVGQVRLISMDGRNNAAPFASILGLIEGARREVVVVSPYVTFPFTQALARARGRGVEVRLVTPGTNNKPIAGAFVLGEARRHGFEVRLAPRMSHVKAMAIDGERLVAGSSNFDFVSLAAEEELVAVISSPALVADFLSALEATLAQGGDVDPPTAFCGGWTTPLLKIAQAMALTARGAPRTAIDWPPASPVASPEPRRP